MKKGEYKFFKVKGVFGKTISESGKEIAEFINNKERKGWEFVSFVSVDIWILFRKK